MGQQIVNLSTRSKQSVLMSSHVLFACKLLVNLPYTATALHTFVLNICSKPTALKIKSVLNAEARFLMKIYMCNLN